MFGARSKKQDGFEWHKYIRTTIKLKREQRRQRIDDARHAAGQQMSAAGSALAAGSRAAGSAALGGARVGLGAAWLAAQGLSIVLWHALGRLAHVLGQLAQPAIAAVAKPNVGGPLALAGAIAIGAGIGRYRSAGLDREALTTLVIGGLLMAALLPMLSRMMSTRFPSLPNLSNLSPRTGAIAAGVAVLAVAAAWFGSGGGGGMAGLGQLPLIGSAKPVQGRAYAMAGDMLRIGGTTVRLTGIEAPEPDQRCTRAGNRPWRCGAAAESALARLVNGRTASCTLSGKDEAGRAYGQCTVASKDVSAELVRQGHVFADGTIFVRYGTEEREARAAKAGLWSGEAERPAAYRAKLWDEAKRRAPEGCPIKGQVTGSARVYVLPWSPDYERTRVQKARGERWFCSEQEAVAAGFKAAQRG
jgi:endonuclease YncB( thermonuclease family)